MKSASSLAFLIIVSFGYVSTENSKNTTVSNVIENQPHIDIKNGNITNGTEAGYLTKVILNNTTVIPNTSISLNAQDPNIRDVENTRTFEITLTTPTSLSTNIMTMNTPVTKSSTTSYVDQNVKTENNMKIIDETWSRVAFFGASFCSTLGFIVNILTIVVIFKQKEIQELSISPLIFYLTFSNLMLSMGGLSVQAARFYLREWPLPNNTCEYYAYITWTNVSATLHIMVLIGFNRALAMYFYEKANKIFSWRNTSILVTLIWIISFGFLRIFGEKISVTQNTFSCTIFDQNKNTPNTLAMITSLEFSILWTLMLCSNAYVYYKMKKRSKEIKQSTFYIGRRLQHISLHKLKRNNSIVKIESRITLTAAITFLSFTLLYLPCKYKNLQVCDSFRFWMSHL